MKKYKLTNQDMTTHNGCKWDINVPKETDGDSDSLCNKHWLHYYHHPLLAVLLNPIHGDIDNPRLFEVKALGKHLDDNGLKGGCTKMTLVKEIELPEITLNQKIAFGILCALEIYKESTYVLWANNWLNNADRSTASAYAASDAYACAAAAAADYASYAARAAADYASYAARAAVRAADHYAADIDAARDVARAAAAAAYAAADAAAYAVDAYAAARYAAAHYAADIDLIKLAKKALKYKI
jgi:hypothetical protein